MIDLCHLAVVEGDPVCRITTNEGRFAGISIIVDALRRREIADLQRRIGEAEATALRLQKELRLSQEDMAAERKHVAELEAKIGVLTEEVAKLRKRAVEAIEIEPIITKVKNAMDEIQRDLETLKAKVTPPKPVIEKPEPPPPQQPAAKKPPEVAEPAAPEINSEGN